MIKLKESIKKIIYSLKEKFYIKVKNKDGEEKTKFNYKPILYLIICLVFIISATFYVIKEINKNEIEAANNKMEELYYSGSFENSIEELKVIQEKDDSPIWIVREAEIYSVKGDFETSNNLLEKAMNKRNEKKKIDNIEEDKDLLNRIVFTFLMNGENEKALELGTDYLEIYEDNKNLTRTMISVYMINDKRDKSIELVKNYNVDKSSAYDMAVYAEMEMALGEVDEGLSILKKAWKLDKNEIKVFDSIAQLSVYDENYLEEKINTLIKGDSNEVCYKLWLAKIYSMREETASKAKQILDELEDDEEVGKINFNIIKAKTYQNLGESDKAKTILNDLMEVGDESYIGYHIAALYYLDNEEYDEALDYCKKSISKNKDYPDNYGFLIPDIMLKQGKKEEAEPYMRTALLKEPFNYNMILNISDYYLHSINDSNKALYYLNIASKIQIKNEKILYKMALINIDKNNLKEAETFLNKSIEVNNNNYESHRTLGTIYINNGNLEDALKEFESAYKLNDNDPLTLNNLGCIYISISGDVKKGMDMLKEAKKNIEIISDEKSKKSFQDNYNVAEKLYKEYLKEDGRELEVPDFTLFY